RVQAYNAFQFLLSHPILSGIVPYKQPRLWGGSALPDFQLLFHSPCHRLAVRASLRTHPGIIKGMKGNI
ncbi:MAG: hypothetical protein PF694_09780, partial [Bacteroidetes bacterium]|nr:hypothetical protein [Bacteroidota bacterium]